MKTPERISSDDPRLTSYALGEMDAAEQAHFEAILAGDASARSQVEEIRAAIGTLGAALESEPLPVMSEDSLPTRVRAPVLRFPHFYFAAAGLAAACFGIVFVMHEAEAERSRARESLVIRHEVDVARPALPPPPAPMPAAVASAAPADSRRAARNAFALAAGSASMPDRFFSTGEAAISSFPLRVGRESLEEVREQLRRGVRPDRRSVHVAEMINGFNYAWPEPVGDEPFATLLEDTAAPWAPDHRLVRVGIRVAGESGILAAIDASVRVEFDPASVRAWRLIGFERDEPGVAVRGLSGEYLRGGDTVTALYEILPAANPVRDGSTWLTFELSYRDPQEGEERLLTRRLEASQRAFPQASTDLKFIAAIAAFGLVLQESPRQPEILPEDLAGWAAAGAGQDEARREFAELMRRMPR